MSSYSTPIPFPACSPSHGRSHHGRPYLVQNRHLSTTCTDDEWPTTFPSLSSLSHTRRKALFKIGGDSSDDDSEDECPPRFVRKRKLASFSFGLRIPTPGGRPAAIPEVSSPQPSPPLSPICDDSPTFPSTRPSVVQTISRTPLLLANGTPLKSSLKPGSAITTTTRRAHGPCSSSMSHPGMVSNHDKDLQELPRIITPSTPKNVHFADTLASIRVFHKFAPPASISMSPASGYENHEDVTESSSDEQDSFDWGLWSTPWIHRRTIDSKPVPFFQIDTLASSPIPLRSANSTTGRCIVLESLILVGGVNLSETRQPNSDNIRLAGTVLVRNISLEKKVDIRFTLDSWDTVSEVEALWSNHMNVLPLSVTGTSGSFPLDQLDNERDERGWDRFSFTIRLCDYVRSLPSKTLFLAARFQAESNQEWWDNNFGSNYVIRFREVQKKRTSRTFPILSSTTETSVPRILASPIIAQEHSLSSDSIPASISHSPSSPPLTVPSTPTLLPIIANEPVTYLDLDPVPPCPPNSPNSSTSPILTATTNARQVCKLSLGKFASYCENGSVDDLNAAVSGCPSNFPVREPKVEVIEDQLVDYDISCSSSDDDVDELTSCSSEDGNNNDDGSLLITPLEGTWRQLEEEDVMDNTKLPEFVWPELPALEHFSTSSHPPQSPIDSSHFLYKMLVQHWCFADSASSYSV